MGRWDNGTMRQWDNGTMGQWDNEKFLYRVADTTLFTFHLSLFTYKASQTPFTFQLYFATIMPTSVPFERSNILSASIS